MRVLATALFVCCACSSESTSRPSDAGTSKAESSRDASKRDASTDPAMPASCGDPAPTVCPSPMPSYSKDVVPIFEAKCNGCHTGGTDKPWPLTDYQSVVDWRIQILQDILGCSMPPADAGKALTVDEQRKVVDWLVCKAPQN